MRKYPFIQVRRAKHGAVFFAACIALFALIAAAGVLVHVQSTRMRAASGFSSSNISSKISGKTDSNVDDAQVSKFGLADELAAGIQIGVETDAMGTAILSSGLNGLLFLLSDFFVIPAPAQKDLGAVAGAQNAAASSAAAKAAKGQTAKTQAAETPAPKVQAAKTDTKKAEVPKNVQQNLQQPAQQPAQKSVWQSLGKQPVQQPAQQQMQAAAAPTDAVPVRGASSRGSTSGAAFYLFVVLDDAGAALSQLDPFYQFPEFDNLTVSILPHLRDSRKVADALDARGAAYMVHMPMQPVGSQDPGPGALMAMQDSETIRRISDENLASFPHSIGTNNHMGSYATSDERLMRALLGAVKARGLFFMDSLTTAKSAASRAAAKEGVRIIKRDVFLDNEPTVQSTLAQLRSMARLARSRGFAVAIGHVTKPTTARALALFYDEVVGQGGAFASLKDYFDITAGLDSGLAAPASAQLSGTLSGASSASSASSDAKGKSNYN